MQAYKFIKNIHPAVKLICLIALTISTIIAKSIYLILFLTTLSLILFYISSMSIKEYIKYATEIFIILSVPLILYTVLSGHYSILVILLYKLALILLMIDIYDKAINFKELHYGINALLSPLKKFNIEGFSYNVSVGYYFIKYFIKSKYEIRKIEKSNGILNSSLKGRISSRLIHTENKINQLQCNLKINFYRILRLKIEFKSKVILILFLLLLIVSVYKEVIL